MANSSHRSPQETNQNPQDAEWGPSTYSLYLKYAKKFDSDMVSQSSDDMDILLIFAALFSAIVTAFLIYSLDDLKEDYSQTSSMLLAVLVNQTLYQNATFTPPPPFQADTSSVIVNSLWTISIILSVNTALGAILCKQWLREYTTRFSPVPSIRAFERHRRYKALKWWCIPELIAILPVILHAAVAFFLAALIVFLQQMNHTVSIVALAMAIPSVSTYFFCFILPFHSGLEAPFITPLTHVVKRITFGLIKLAIWFVLPLVFCVASCFQPQICSLQSCVTMWSRVVPAGHLFRRLLVRFRRDRHDKANIGYYGEIPRAELVSWLVHCPLDNTDVQSVVGALSGIRGRDSLRMLEVHGVEEMLIRRMRSAYFYSGTSGDTIKAIPEFVPAAMNCLQVWFGILEEGVFESGHHPSGSEPMIRALLDVTHGDDQLRVLAASQWIFHFEAQPEYWKYRNQIQNHLKAHVEGSSTLSDDIVRILVDDPYPTVKYSQTVVDVLDHYLKNDKSPSVSCVRAILRVMCTRDTDSSFGARGEPLSHFFVLLLGEERHRPRLLRLIRILSLSDPTSTGLGDVRLVSTLINFLYRNPPLNQSETLDVWEAISCAPQAYHIYDRTIIGRLAKLHRLPPASPIISRVSIKAIAALTESVLCQKSGTVQRDSKLADTASIVAECLEDSPARFQDIDILLPSVYILSLTSGYWRTQDVPPTVLPNLANILSIPSSGRDLAVVQHTLRVIDSILSGDILKGASLKHNFNFLIQLNQLTTCEDFWTRWLSFSVLKRVSFHLTPADRQNAFQLVRDDVERRLCSPSPFIPRDWTDVTDATTLMPPGSPLLRQALMVKHDIHTSGIRQLIEISGGAMVRQNSVYDEFQWLFPFETWMRQNK